MSLREAITIKKKKKKKAREQHQRVGLGHQHPSKSTQLKQLRLVRLGRGRKPHKLSPQDNSAWLDWDIDTDETTPLDNGGRRSLAAMAP